MSALLSSRRLMISFQRIMKLPVEAACRDYFADVELRKERLEERIASLREQADALTADAEQVKPALIRASVEGDDRALLTIQKQLANTEAQRAAISAQIEMLTDAATPGNEDLYDAALEKNNLLEESIFALESVEGVMREFAATQIDAWGKVIELLKSPISVIPYEEWYDIWGRHARDEIAKLSCVRPAAQIKLQPVREAHRDKPRLSVTAMEQRRRSVLKPLGVTDTEIWFVFHENYSNCKGTLTNRRKRRERKT